MDNYTVKGRVWLITDENGQLINDIDTDQIFHNAFLHITEISEMGEHTFGNLGGWEDFPKKCKKGDIVITGGNFGSGSSRQQAVDCFRALGVQAIIAESFGAIYKRNAINSGFPILSYGDIGNVVNNGWIKNLNEVKVDFIKGELLNISTGEILKVGPFSKVQKDIIDKGSLLTI